jgi:excisionase family DNA binding protein
MIATFAPPAPPPSERDAAPDALLTREETARLLNVGARTVDGWVRAGRLPVVRFTPRLVRFRRADLDRFVTQHREGGAYA